jgi:hypothetical protein
MKQFNSIRRHALSLLGCGIFALLSTGAQAKIFQAEDYSAYRDASAGNQGGQYRQDNVDIQATRDTGGGYNVGWIEANEWLEYNKLVIPTNGSYDIRLRVAAPSGARANVSLNSGAIPLGDFMIPSTGDWTTWTTVSRTLTLKAGTYNLRVFAKTGNWNFNWIEVIPHEEEDDEPKATAYQHCNYGGWAASLEARSYKLADLQTLGFRNDDMSALRVTQGYEVVLYEHDNFGGRSVVMTGDKSCFVGIGFNDAVSSLVVRRTGTVTTTPTPTGGDGDQTGDCGTSWRNANLTNFESYPDPGSEECIEYNGCQWQGQFAGVIGVKSESWVQSHNIIAVHEKDWRSLSGKTLQLKQGTKLIKGTVYDYCADSDCSGCCTQNLGGDGYLIDIEKYTMQRFGSGSGTVQFQVCQ